MNYLIVWQARTVIILNGCAYIRYPGDEDILPLRMAMSYTRHGQARIVKVIGGCDEPIDIEYSETMATN